jgi:tRNA threonylcarbamoyl adenosine modification protein YeaZ
MGADSTSSNLAWPREGRVIALDSTLGPGSVALAEGGAVVASKVALGEGKGQLAWLVRELLTERELAPRDLEAVVVGVGPGRFTGVRSAVAVAKGLAWSLGLPLVPVGSLEAVGARSEPVVVLGDGARAAYAGGLEFGAPQGLAHEEFLAWHAGRPAVSRVVGAALGALREALREVSSLHEVDLDAAAHLRAAIAFGLAHGAHEVEPAYVREASITAPRVAPPLLAFRDR